ncbi:MAG: DUF1232 domain-containing protein, partial [Armatimonadota bacterium]
MLSGKDKSKLSFNLIADVAKFVWRLFRSPHVPMRVKILLFGLGVYIACPIDIIPDGIPVLGQLDDVFIAVAALSLAAKWIPKPVIDELWESEITFDEAISSLKGVVKRKVRNKRIG